MPYTNTNEVQDAMSVIAGWIGNNRAVKVVYHNGTAVDADIFAGVIRVPKMACASGITEEALNLLRVRVYHEAGHIDLSKLPKAVFPKSGSPLHSIWNALEDRWMENEEGKKHLGCAATFRWGAEYHNRKIAEKMMAGEIDAALWEALVAMSLMVDGLRPAWSLTPKAAAYVKAANSEFEKVRLSKSSLDNLELAKRILEILKETSEDFEQQNQEPQENQNGSGKGEGSEDGESEETEETEETEEDDSEPKSNSAGDFGDETDEGDEGDETEGEEGEEGDEGEEASGKASEGVEGEEGDESANGKTKPGKGNKPSDEEDKAEASLEDELDGPSMEETFNDEIAKAIDAMDSKEPYLSVRCDDVHEIPETTDEDKTLFKTRREMVSVMVATMTRALEQALRSMTRCRKQSYLQSGKVDNRRLVQIAKSLSREVFAKTRQGSDLDSVVEIIMDESGSMDEWMEIQLLAMVVCEGLTAIGVPFELTGTTTLYGAGDRRIPELNGMTRTNPIRYRHYKTFGENWMTVRHRLVKSSCFQHNIDGETIEYAAMRLIQRKESKKIIFSLTDGQPCGGHGISSDTVMAQNLMDVCARVRKAGIKVIGFGINTNAPEKFYGKENFVCLDNVQSMSQDFIRKMIEVVTGGSVKV